ncbi:hypothetical protein GIB67_041504, partial [Kingdonia uniflora]
MDYVTSPGSSPLEICIIYLELGILSYPNPLQDRCVIRTSCPVTRDYAVGIIE